jgi:hypothetical protein
MRVHGISGAGGVPTYIVECEPEHPFNVSHCRLLCAKEHRSKELIHTRIETR